MDKQQAAFEVLSAAVDGVERSLREMLDNDSVPMPPEVERWLSTKPRGNVTELLRRYAKLHEVRIRMADQDNKARSADASQAANDALGRKKVVVSLQSGRSVGVRTKSAGTLERMSYHWFVIMAVDRKLAEVEENFRLSLAWLLRGLLRQKSKHLRELMVRAVAPEFNPPGWKNAPKSRRRLVSRLTDQDLVTIWEGHIAAGPARATLFLANQSASESKEPEYSGWNVLLSTLAKPDRWTLDQVKEDHDLYELLAHRIVTAEQHGEEKKKEAFTGQF